MYEVYAFAVAAVAVTLTGVWCLPITLRASPRSLKLSFGLHRGRESE